jgi:phosphoglycolate phosphatase-like HAD superfamily hydrolase
MYGVSPDPAAKDGRPLAIVDLDGVLADVRHRLRHVDGRHKDWDAFFAGIPDDPPLAEGVAVLERLLADHEVILLTGRPERTRAATERWLSAQGLPRLRVIMRREGDRRPARQVKRQLVRRLAAGRTLGAVVDDDPEVCAALEADGWPVFRADWMDRAAPLHRAQERDGRT